MKRTRAQQPAKATEPQDADAGTPTTTTTATKPQRRAKQPRQPKQGAKKQPAPSAGTPTEGGAAVSAATNAAASPGLEMAATVPDVCGGTYDYEAGTQNMDWDLDGGLGGGGGGAAWWTWGVDEDKLLGWFPFDEEDLRCLGGRGGCDAAEVAFDDDIWKIHQIYEIPNYAAK